MNPQKLDIKSVIGQGYDQMSFGKAKSDMQFAKVQEQVRNQQQRH